MPRVNLGRCKGSAELFGIMKEKGVSQKEIADRIGATQSAVSKKIKGLSFTVQEFQTIARMLEMDDNEVLQVIRGI